MPGTATKPDRLQEAHDRLTQAVESIVSGDDWQRMLKVAAKFHHYSLNIQLMIMLQASHATQVAGFNRRKSPGSTVLLFPLGCTI
ncbi:MAG: hypothetical protein ACR2KQ_09985 [Actinomycetota bacterium]